MSEPTNASPDDTATTSPSYHDLHIATAKIPRTSIFNLPYGYEVTCTRVGGWSLWFRDDLVAGEYDNGLVLDVAGSVIVNSLGRDVGATS